MSLLEKKLSVNAIDRKVGRLIKSDIARRDFNQHNC
jgi:hypothetical protein